LITIIKKVKANPLLYARRVLDPHWWLWQIKKMTHHQRMEAKECKQVSNLLHGIDKRNFQDTAYHRKQNLVRILQYAGQHCLYYKNVFRQIGFDPQSLEGFDSLPLLDKAAIRRHRDALISDKADKMGTYVMNTGGSTGEPLEFLVASIAAFIDKIHLEYVLRHTMQYEPTDTVVAFDGSSVPTKSLNRHIYWVETDDQGTPYGALAYSSLYLTEETVPYYVEHILNTAPCIFRGYPSFINDIAEYVLKHDITIPFRVKGILLTAENTHDWQIENIRRAFNTRVFLQYGHSEVCVYGYTFDETHEYYCSPFYGFTEVLGNDGRHVNPGDIGEIVVTGFYNFAMPFIRYRTGDMAVFNGDLGGIVRLGKIIGRTQDFVITETREKIALTALIFGQHYHAFKNIQKWQLHQDAPGKVIIKLIKGETFSEEDEVEIRGKFKNICGIDTEFEYVDSIPLTPRGKFQFLVQNIRS